MPTSTYSPSVAPRVATFVLGLLLTVAAAILIPRIVLGSMLKFHVVWVLVAVFVVIMVIGLGLTVWRVFIAGPITIRTNPTSVELYRGGALRETWSRADTWFSSYVIRQTTNGIPSGTIRKLIVGRPTDRLELVLPWYSARTFNALLADVAPQVPTPEIAAPIAPITASSGTFTLDHSPVRRSRAVATGILVIGLLAAIGFIAVGVGQEDFDVVIVVAGFALVMVVLIAGGFLLRGMRIPKQLTVSPSTLTVDERVFPLALLTAISATPASYEGRRRALSLTDTTGRRTLISFGTFGNRAFPDYDRYLEALRGATAHRPGLFTLDVA